MDSETDRRATTAYEQARNERYIAALKRKLETPIGYGQSRSQEWLKGHPHLGRDYAILHPLVGRVGLSKPAELLPRSFYIGPRHIESEGVEAFSWHAEIARLYFQPDYPHRLVDTVVVRRTLDHRLDTIVDVTDEWVVTDRADDPFVAEELQIPAAPPIARSRRTESRTDVPPARPAEPVPTTTQHEQPADPTPEPVLEAAPAQPGIEATPPPSLLEGMRAPEAVVKRLQAPRDEKLQSVLTMLQPDQHAMATTPSAEPLIIQGHPGTGKTIIAAYRAGFLAEEHRETNSTPRKVLLVGPTTGYVGHVVGLIAPLADIAHIRVSDMQTFLRDVTGLKPQVGGTLDGVHDDVDALARGLVDAAARIIRRGAGFKTGTNARTANIRLLYELLRSNGTPASRVTNDPAKVEWTTRLPPYERAARQRRYLGLMSQCALAIQTPAHTYAFDHIIVDEAQDVSPIEWNVLDSYNRRGHWTLVGDMNQRRSDTSYASWSDIADHLALGSDDEPVEPVVIKRGYRSTQPILKFADKLLPREQRGALTLQSQGPGVGTHRVAQSAPAALAKEAIFRARSLCASYPDGTVAVITNDVGILFETLGKGGWRRDGEHAWVYGQSSLHVHVPETARGLEFDGVVVVEPASFPKNFGRSGQLYTSLTRANRELAVVYHKALPDQLRSASRN